MLIEVTVYRVEQKTEPEYGATRSEWVKYFSGKNEQEVLDYVYRQYGRPRYFAMDRESTKYYISKLYVEEAKSGSESDY